jgi:catechol 2,3-dioxygenase-like lactoylglutathione lyase family enzyme
MKSLAFALTILLCCTASSTGDAPKRPRITEIGFVMVGTQNQQKSEEFYHELAHALLPQSLEICEGCKSIPVETFFPIGSKQLKSEPTSNLLDHVAFMTDDAKALREWVQSHGYKAGDLQHVLKFFSFTVSDPEGHKLQFTQSGDKKGGNKTTATDDSDSSGPGGVRLIHAGWVVEDRAAMDKFYKEILGFHVYWRGGMKDDETDWVDMQVPDGTDWIEYMLNVPANAGKHTLGVMNHIALGVLDIKAAREQLLKNGMKLTEEPKIGRDGKWQLNLYDPDDTRVEFMEFTPVQKPCCSEYTGPHPKP